MAKQQMDIVIVAAGEAAQADIMRHLPEQDFQLRCCTGISEAREVYENRNPAAMILRIGEGVARAEVIELLSYALRAAIVVIDEDDRADVAAGFIREGAQEYLTISEVNESALRRAIAFGLARKLAAQSDNLTGLIHRDALNDRLATAIRQARRYDHEIALLFIDLDRFHVINDAYGHETGDAVLSQVAKRLLGIFRDSDTVARMGSDIFIALLPNLPNPHWITNVTAKIFDTLSKPVTISETEFRVTSSVGVSIFPSDAQAPGELLRCADAAMKLAKSTGGNSFQYFGEGMQSETERRARLAQDLRQTVDGGGFELFYQPQIDTSSGGVTGVEALIRWQHPTLGMVPPDEFLPVVEDMGLMVKLGDWVLQTACRQRHEWNLAGVADFPVAVNLSAHQFEDDHLLEHIRNALQRFQLDPGDLEVEMTEGSVMQDPEGTRQTLQELHSAGVRIAIDDFGTGYSSLAYLNRFPLDVLKIDRTFVNEITTDGNGPAIVKTIINLAENLGLHSVAEGVETAEQLEFVRANGGRAVQGYLFSKPVPASDIPKVMDSLADDPLARSLGRITASGE